MGGDAPKSDLAPRQYSRHRKAVILFVASVGRGLLFMEITIVGVALPSIQAGLRASPAVLVWTVNAYVLAMCVLMVAGGRLGDALGHRRMMDLGLWAFALASVGCALAPSPPWLIAARAL